MLIKALLLFQESKGQCVHQEQWTSNPFAHIQISEDCSYHLFFPFSTVITKLLNSVLEVENIYMYTLPCHYVHIEI